MNKTTNTKVVEQSNLTKNLPNDLRQVLNFNTGWLFSPSNLENGYQKELDERMFQQVSVPHANKILTKHKGEDFQEQIESYRFISWYRRHFPLDSSYEGKRIYVEFEAVATIADVYVNGKFVGTHKGAYTGFTYDITDYVKTDKSDNVIAVRVDSRKQTEVPPEGGNVDYCIFGGIVRNVNMIITNPLHITDTFLTTPGLSNEEGRVQAQVEIKNASGKEAVCGVEIAVKDHLDNIVALTRMDQTILTNETVTFHLDTSKISKPHLWDIHDPYLYKAEIRVIKDGQYVDYMESKIGFRWFECTNTDEESAFYLNGKKTTLIGVNRHEQWPWIGRAVPNRLQIADADLIKETGINIVRASHYPQNKAFLQRCDEIGLMVFEEPPGWQHIGGEEWKKVFHENLKEMILRDRNHPSIISWGVRVNESFDDHDLYEETNSIAKVLDPTRPTHGVRRFETYEDSECQEDIFAVNYTYPEIPRIRPYIITEYSMDWFSGNGLPSATDRQAVEFIKAYAEPMNYYFGNKLVAGGIAWSMFDYNNEVNYTKTGHVFYSGLYDIFRLEKPVAYLYRAQKDPKEEIVLYIANDWTENSPSTITILSNCDEVEILVNGESRARIKPNAYLNLPHPIFQFENITFEAGELKAVGLIDGKEVASVIKKTPGRAVALDLKADDLTLVADGTDMTRVIILALDSNGNRVAIADHGVTIEVEGAGRFIGEQKIKLEGGRAIFFLQSHYLTMGIVTCHVSANGLNSASCEISVTEFVPSATVPLS